MRNMEHRYRISNEERELVINVFEKYILNNYDKISNEELRNCLKFIIKIITFDRIGRKAFERRIDRIIKKFNKGKIKEAKIMIKRITREYEKEREKIIVKRFNKIEREVYEWLSKNKLASEEKLQDHFFSICYSQGMSKREAIKAYNRFFDKLFYKLGFKDKIVKSKLIEALKR
jgi:hypothetical protein